MPADHFQVKLGGNWKDTGGPSCRVQGLVIPGMIFARSLFSSAVEYFPQTLLQCNHSNCMLWEACLLFCQRECFRKPKADRDPEFRFESRFHM